MESIFQNFRKQNVSELSASNTWMLQQENNSRNYTKRPGNTVNLKELDSVLFLIRFFIVVVRFWFADVKNPLRVYSHWKNE